VLFLNSTKKLTRTAILLAITLAFQALRFIPFIGTLPYGTYIIGSLVNLMLLMTALTVGIDSAVFISIVTPIVAFMQGHLVFPLLIPVIALGNIIVCVLFYYIKGYNKYAAVAIGAVAKWIFLYYAVQLVLSSFMKLPPEKFAVAIAAFNVPQLITALIGGFLSIVIYQLLPENLKN